MHRLRGIGVSPGVGIGHAVLLAQDPLVIRFPIAQRRGGHLATEAGVGNDIARVEKPWGYELHWAKTDRYVGKVLHIKAGHALSLQYHNRKEETILVWSGRLVVEVGDAAKLERRELGPGDRVHVPPGTFHRMTAVEDCDLFEVSTPEIDDVVRLQDNYGREGTTEP